MSNVTGQELAQYAGWAGAVVILIAYYCITNGILDARAYRYQSMNVIGSSGIAASAIATNSLPSVVLNFLWILIACVSMCRRYAQDRVDAEDPR